MGSGLLLRFRPSIKGLTSCINPHVGGPGFCSTLDTPQPLRILLALCGEVLITQLVWTLRVRDSGPRLHLVVPARRPRLEESVPSSTPRALERGARSSGTPASCQLLMAGLTTAFDVTNPIITHYVVPPPYALANRKHDDGEIMKH